MSRVHPELVDLGSRRRGRRIALAIVVRSVSGTAATPAASVRPLRRARQPRPRRARRRRAQRHRRSVRVRSFTRHGLPGDAVMRPCGVAPYTGHVQEDHGDRRADRRVPAVRAGRRLPAEGRVQRRSASRTADYLAAHAPDKSYLDAAERHRALHAQGVEQGQPDRLRGQPRLLGRARPRRPNLEFRWSDEAAQRLLELQSGTVDGIDNPGTDDIATIKADST